MASFSNNNSNYNDNSSNVTTAATNSSVVNKSNNHRVPDADADAIKRYIDSHIDSIVKDLKRGLKINLGEISSDLSSQIRREIQDIKSDLHAKLDKDLRSVRTNIDSTISAQVDTTMKTILLNNVRFDQLFKSYNEQFAKRLEQTGHNIIDRISKDPKHNEVVTSYLNNVQTTCQAAIEQNKANFERQLGNHRTIIDTELKSINNRYKTDFKALNEGLEEQEALRTDLAALRARTGSLESWNNYLAGGVAVLTAANVGLGLRVFKYIKF